MFNPRHLALEAVVVGLALALALTATTQLFRVTIGTGQTSVVVGLVLGAGLHLAFELAGLNRTYCSTGHACQLN